MVLLVDDTSSFGNAVIRVLLVLLCLLLRYGKQIVNIVSAYVLQVGLNAEGKDDFWDNLIIMFSGVPKQDNIFIGGDLNSHVGWYEVLWWCPWLNGVWCKKRWRRDDFRILWYSGHGGVKHILQEGDYRHHNHYSIDWLLVRPMEPVKNKMIKFVQNPRVWKLKDERTTRNYNVTKTDDFHKKAPNNTAYKRWSCHRGFGKLLYKWMCSS